MKCIRHGYRVGAFEPEFFGVSRRVHDEEAAVLKFAVTLNHIQEIVVQHNGNIRIEDIGEGSNRFTRDSGVNAYWSATTFGKVGGFGADPLNP